MSNWSSATSATPPPSARRWRGVDAVYHLAAAVGVGQSMYEIAEYTSLNNLGTAVLLEAPDRTHRSRSSGWSSRPA